MIKNICPKCEGTGFLKDAVQAWDCGEESPECDLCRGEGTWTAINEYVNELKEGKNENVSRSLGL